MNEETLFELQDRRSQILARLAEVENQIRRRQNELLAEHQRARAVWLKSIQEARNVRLLSA